MVKNLGIAMVGHAFMGRAHSNAFRQVGHFFDLPFDVSSRVVVGRDHARVEAARKKFGFEEASTDLSAVLARDDVHIVDVATPNDSHADIAIAALKAGKHVLCEKPLALDLAQARRMATLAKKMKARVGLWHNYRRCPAASLAQAMIKRGEIGKIRQVRAVYLQDWLSDEEAQGSWRTKQKVCGSGAHGDLNAHLIDMTHFLTGLRFAEVTGLEQTFVKRRKDADGKSRTVDVDDALAFLARFEGGAIGTFEATRMAPGRKNFNQIEVNGSQGSIRWNLERMNELELFRFDDPRDGQGFRRIMCMDEPHPYAANWWPDGHILGYEHTFVHTLADFLRSLRGRKAFSPDFDDGVRVQAVLDAALKSAKTRRWVKVSS
ncbi:MAG: Gfo/Idh/MocA family protein [Planctomycetota bacterium]|jgi:predicted dehydrogenase